MKFVPLTNIKINTIFYLNLVHAQVLIVVIIIQLTKEISCSAELSMNWVLIVGIIILFAREISCYAEFSTKKVL